MISSLPPVRIALTSLSPSSSFIAMIPRVFAFAKLSVVTFFTTPPAVAIKR